MKLTHPTPLRQISSRTLDEVSAFVRENIAILERIEQQDTAKRVLEEREALRREGTGSAEAEASPEPPEADQNIQSPVKEQPHLPTTAETKAAVDTQPAPRADAGGSKKEKEAEAPTESAPPQEMEAPGAEEAASDVAEAESAPPREMEAPGADEAASDVAEAEVAESDAPADDIDGSAEQ